MFAYIPTYMYIVCVYIYYIYFIFLCTIYYTREYNQYHHLPFREKISAQYSMGWIRLDVLCWVVEKRTTTLNKNKIIPHKEKQTCKVSMWE